MMQGVGSSVDEGCDVRYRDGMKAAILDTRNLDFLLQQPIAEFPTLHA